MPTPNFPIDGRSLARWTETLRPDVVVRRVVQESQAAAGTAQNSLYSASSAVTDALRQVGVLPKKSSSVRRDKKVGRPISISTPDQKTLDRLNAVLAGLAKYHGYEVHGLEKLPKDGGFLVASTHSLATYEMALFMRAVKQDQGRDLRMLVEHLIFKTPGLNTFAANCGAVDGYKENAIHLLEQDAPVGVCPGGMKEALRPSERAYELEWEDRLGFVRVALATQKPIFVAVCPAADQMYRVFGNPLTDALEKRHLPAPVAVGRCLTPVPNPVKLDHYVSDAIQPPPLPPDVKMGSPEFEALVRQVHAEVLRVAEAEMAARKPAEMPRLSTPWDEVTRLIEACPRPEAIWDELRSMAMSEASALGSRLRAEAQLRAGPFADPKRAVAHLGREALRRLSDPGAALRDAKDGVGRLGQRTLEAARIS